MGCAGLVGGVWRPRLKDFLVDACSAPPLQTLSGRGLWEDLVVGWAGVVGEGFGDPRSNDFLVDAYSAPQDGRVSWERGLETPDGRISSLMHIQRPFCRPCLGEVCGRTWWWDGGLEPPDRRISSLFHYSSPPPADPVWEGSAGEVWRGGEVCDGIVGEGSAREVGWWDRRVS